VSLLDTLARPCKSIGVTNEKAEHLVGLVAGRFESREDARGAALARVHELRGRTVGQHALERR
jgi:hypothetical protein